MDQLCNLILALYRAARETPVDEFQELALALIRAQTHFRTALWGAGEMTSDGLVAHSVHLHNEPPEMLSDWASVNRKDTVIDTVYANPGRSFISHTPSRYHTSEDGIILDYAQRYGHMSIMVVSTMGASQPVGQWLSLYRPDQHDHFSQADGRMLEQIMPHLVEALEINRMLGEISLAHADSGTAGTRAVVRTDGTLYHCGKKFAELLLEVWPDWKSGQLPTELMAAVYPNKESILAEHGIAVTTSTMGNMLLLNIHRISPLCNLSQRELEVATLYGQGQSYKGIALALDISPSTVRCFLGRIYTKLGIGNKMDLATLLSQKMMVYWLMALSLDGVVGDSLLTGVECLCF